MPDHDTAQPPLLRDRQIIAAAVGAVVAAIATGVVAVIVSGSSGGASTTSGTPAPPVGTVSSAPGSSATPGPTAPSAAATRLAYAETSTDTSDGAQTGDVKVDSAVRPDSVYFEETCLPDYSYTDKVRNVTYDLNRRYRRLRAVGGLRDDSSESARARLTVYGDGRRLAGADVSLGKPAPLDVNVTGVLRLRLEITWTGGFDCPLPNRPFMTAVWGTPTIA